MGAQITPKKLQEMLDDSGRKVSLRALTDWRAKGLLPSLEKCGRGPNQGVGRASNPDTFERACIVFDTLARTRRMEAAVLALWYMGHSVSVSLFRHALRARIRAIRSNHQNRSGELIGDVYSREIDEVAAALEIQQNLSTFAARAVAYEGILAIHASPEGGRSPDEISQLIDAAPALRRALGDWVPMVFTRERIAIIQNFYRPLLSVPQKSSLFRSATDRQLLVAHNHYQKFGKYLGQLTRLAAQRAKLPDAYYGLKYMLAPLLGPMIFQIMLHLVRSQNAWRLQATFDLVSRFNFEQDQRPDMAPTAKTHEIDFVTEISAIWRDLRPEELYS